MGLGVVELDFLKGDGGAGAEGVRGMKDKLPAALIKKQAERGVSAE